MPPATSPTRERILEAIVASFQAMTVEEYFYPPDKCAAIKPPVGAYLKNIAREHLTVYGIWFELEDVEERATTQVTRRLQCFIQGATRYEPVLTDPYMAQAGGQESEEEVRSRLIHDAVKVIELSAYGMGGTQLGGLVENWEQIGSDPYDLNLYETPGWVAFEMETRLIYFTQVGDPTTP